MEGKGVQTIHCSYLPVALRCHQALAVPFVPMEHDAEETRLGRAVHRALAATFQGDTTDPAEFARRLDVDPKRVAALRGVGLALWEEFGQKDVRIGPRAELALALTVNGPDGLSRALLVGTLDVLYETLDGPVIWDWKTGSADASAQMRGYATLALAEIGRGSDIKPAAATVVVASLGDAMVSVTRYTRADCEDLIEQIGKALDAEQPPYVPGSWCVWCRRAAECPARTAATRAAGDALVAIPAGLPATPQILAAMKPRADTLRRALDAYDAALRSAIQEAGPVPIGDGREVAIEERPQDEIMFCPQLLETLRPRLRMEQWAEAVTVAKGKLLDAVAAVAPRGEKGKSRGALLDMLRAVGAVRQVRRERLVTRAVAPPALEVEEGKDGNG